MKKLNEMNAKYEVRVHNFYGISPRYFNSKQAAEKYLRSMIAYEGVVMYDLEEDRKREQAVKNHYDEEMLNLERNETK